MAMVVICPGCDKRLRLRTQPANGKKVKCPSCAEVFVPVEEDDAQTGIQAKATVSSRARSEPRYRDDDEDDNTSVRERHRDGDANPRSRKKKAKQRSGSKMLLYGGLIGAAAFVLLLVCSGIGVTAFVWPGFMLSKTKAKDAQAAGHGGVKDAQAAGNGGVQKAEKAAARVPLTRYLMPDADLVVGVSAKGLREAGQLEPFIMGFQGAQAQPLPHEVTEIFRDSDQVVASLNLNAIAKEMDPGQFGPPGPPAGGNPGAKGGQKGVGPKGGGPPGGPKGQPGRPQGQPPFAGPNLAVPPKVAIAVLMANAGLAAKAKGMISAVEGAGQPEQLAGKYTLLRRHDPRAGQVLFAFPTDRIIVITASPTTDQELTALLDKASRNDAAPAQLAKMMPMVDQTHVWAALSAGPQVRTALGMLPMVLGQQDVPAAVKGAAQALGKVKGLGLALDVAPGGAGATIQLHFDCDDLESARRLKDGGDTLKQMAFNKAANDPATPPSLRQDLNTLTFTTQGTMVSGRMTLSEQTMRGAGGGPPAFVPPGGPRFPPPGGNGR